MRFSTYHPTSILRNGHFNTIFSALYRKGNPQPFQRKRLTTFDGDFIDIDYLQGGYKRAVVLLHGLEGSTSSGYILRNSELFHTNGWDIAAINYRARSGELNRSERTYHSGCTKDVQSLMDDVLEHYEVIVMIGFSLGGSFALRYAGEMGTAISKKIKTVIAVSVPFDLSKCVRHIDERWDNKLYQQQFLNSLKQTARLKAAQYPEVYTEEKIKAATTLFEFDDLFTAPINGFDGAADYHHYSSSKHLIPDIRIPTLIINALDDPFLPEPEYPSDIAPNQQVRMLTPKYGGHVAFAYFRGGYNWVDGVMYRYILEIMGRERLA